MLLYSLLLFFSILIPLVLSFDKKVSFYKIWRFLFPSTVIVGSVYIAADIIFVKYGVWGFNPEYHSRIVLLGLPVEEWLFFIIIPYASVFIHYVYVAYWPNLLLSNNFVRIFTSILILILIAVVIFNIDKLYTAFNFGLLVCALVWALAGKKKVLNSYFISFLIILIPFFIVNSILTGSFIQGEVVWYNNSETLGIRLGTVPVEDLGYAFSLVLLNLITISELKKISGGE